MSIYIVGIDGRPLAAVNAENSAEAEDLVKGQEFRDDLLTFESGGTRLWDGTSELVLREARPGEEEMWRETWAMAEDEGDVEEGDQLLVWLVDIDNPGDDPDEPLGGNRSA